MYGGYYGGWIPSTYITEDIPLTVYEMMKYHPLMAKELRKSYSLMAFAVLRAILRYKWVWRKLSTNTLILLNSFLFTH